MMGCLDAYTFAYDRLNRLVTKTPSSGAVVSYTYDLAGRTLTVSTPAVTGDQSTGTFSLAYDAAERMYQEQYPDGKTVTATMDANGNVTTIEFSHWIPDRIGGPRSIWNGNYVSREVHALSDPYRYRFMSTKAFKEANPLPFTLHQQIGIRPVFYRKPEVKAA